MVFLELLAILNLLVEQQQNVRMPTSNCLLFLQKSVKDVPQCSLRILKCVVSLELLTIFPFFLGKMKGLAFIQDPDGYWIEILNPNHMVTLT